MDTKVIAGYCKVFELHRDAPGLLLILQVKQVHVRGAVTGTPTYSRIANVALPQESQELLRYRIGGIFHGCKL